MIRKKAKIAFWLIVLIAIGIGIKALSQDAVEIFQDSQSDAYEWTDDERQDWTVFWLCRELDSLREIISENEVARREDDKEMRAQIWKLALIVGGGGLAGGAGSAAIIRKRKRGG